MRTESVQIRNFIDGQFVEPIGGRFLDNIEPATGKPYSQVADGDARDVEVAVVADSQVIVAVQDITLGVSKVLFGFVGLRPLFLLL